MSGKIEAVMDSIINSGNDTLLCEKHKALADAFLRHAVEAVKHVGLEDPSHLQMEVNKSLVVFLGSWRECVDCKALRH